MRGLDWIVAPLALICFALTLAVVPLFVPDLDLIIVCAFAVALAAFDFWRVALRGGNNNSKSR